MAKRALSQMTYGAARRTLVEADCLKGEHLLWDGGDTDAAAQLFGAAISADPSYGRGAYDLGALHQYLGVTRHDPNRAEEAKGWYAKAAALDSKDPLANKALAVLEK
jgi:tetratricopeptide (TPR) repeat protein